MTLHADDDEQLQLWRQHTQFSSSAGPSAVESLQLAFVRLQLVWSDVFLFLAVKPTDCIVESALSGFLFPASHLVFSMLHQNNSFMQIAFKQISGHHNASFNVDMGI